MVNYLLTIQPPNGYKYKIIFFFLQLLIYIITFFVKIAFVPPLYSYFFVLPYQASACREIGWAWIIISYQNRKKKNQDIVDYF